MNCAERAHRARRFPLEIRATRTPDALALIWREGSLSYGGLDLWTRSMARALLARGIARGERVALRLPPGPAYPALLLALLRAGCVAVPVSTRVPADAIPALLEGVGCRRLIAESGAPAIAAAGIEILDPGMLRSLPVLSPSLPLRERGNDLPPFDPATPATIVFTSGSSGIPKAALHSFENHWASAVGANRNLPLRPGDRWLLSLPLWHVGGIAVIFRCLQAGAAVVIAAGDETLSATIESCAITHLSLVATQLHRLLRDPGGREALRSLKAVLLGGGPVPAPLVDEAVGIGARLVTSYGSTEMSSQASATRPGDPPEALRTAGRALPFREVAIGAGGEILVRGRTLFPGYVEGAGIRSARDKRGWFPTGDIGRIDAAGRLVIEGRRDAMFISGGENIHPEEIERELTKYPGVLDAIVVPVPDPEFGARPAAFLRTISGEMPDAATVGAFLRATLPGFKVPARYLAWPDLGEGMKPDRRALETLARPRGGVGRE